MEHNHSIPKLKFHIWLFALTIISIAVALFSPITPIAPIPTYADSMIEQEPAGIGLDKLNTGISYRHTGWLFYLAYPDGVEASEVTAILSYDDDITTSAGDVIPNNNRFLCTINLTRFTDYENMETDAPWGPPFDNDNNFRGNDVREWLKNDSDGNGHVQAADIIAEWFGVDWALKWESKEVYLVFEPFYWARLVSQGKTTGYWLCGTAHRWGQIQAIYGIDRTVENGRPVYKGASLTQRYTNNTFPNCVTLEDCPEIRAMGLNAPTHGGILENEEMHIPITGPHVKQTTGYGIGIVWTDGYQTTCDEPEQPAPHRPPNESPGSVSIIKSYRTRNTVTNELEDGGTFIRHNVFNQILIEDETDYQVVGWKTSSTIKSSISSLTWETSVPGTIGSSGTTADIATLSGTQKCLYVLLEKVVIPPPPEVTPEEWDFQIPESQIAKRVTFLDSAKTLTLYSHEFKWTAPAPTVKSCYAHGGNGHHLNCSKTWDREPREAKDGVKHECTEDCEEGCDKEWDEEPVEKDDGQRHTHGNSCYNQPCKTWKWTDDSVKLAIALSTTGINNAVVSKSRSITYNDSLTNTIEFGLTHMGLFFLQFFR